MLISQEILKKGNPTSYSSLFIYTCMGLESRACGGSVPKGFMLTIAYYGRGRTLHGSVCPELLEDFCFQISSGTDVDSS